VPHPRYLADKILNDVALVQLPANALPAYTGKTLLYLILLCLENAQEKAISWTKLFTGTKILYFD
jgi:hypothetical protein